MSELEQLKSELAAFREELKAHQVLLTVILSTMPIDNRVDFMSAVVRINRELYPPEGISLNPLSKYVVTPHSAVHPKPRNQ